MGHNKPHTEETKKRLSLSHMGKKPSKESILKGIQTKKDKGYKHSEETKKKIGLGNKGKKRTEEERILMSKNIKNDIVNGKRKLPPNKLGTHRTQEQKDKQRDIMKKIANPKWVKKCLARRPKSSLEIKMENILNKLQLPYKFVGNGEVFVGKKNPDFVHNTEKIAIEVYYRKHKQMFRGDVDGWKADRTEIFTKEGWRIIFFDETQVNENTVKSVLGV
jgi:very-short-patch-repair endonuclease